MRVLVAILLFLNIYLFQDIITIIVPVSTHFPSLSKMDKLKDRFNLSTEVINAITIASATTQISPILLTALAYTESNFNPYAISSKGYKGIMQTPWATGRFVSVDILHGAEILKEKLRISDGDLFKALAMYKGGTSIPQACKQARRVINLYTQLQTEI